MAIGTDNVAEEALRYMRNPGGYGNMVNGVEQVAQIGLDEATAAVEVAEGSDALIAAGAMAEAVGLSVGWVILLAIAGILVGARLTEYLWLRAAEKLPWPFGGALRGIVKVVFGPLDNLEDTVAKKMGAISAQILTAWFKGIRSFLVFELGAPLATGGGVSQAQLTHLQNEINQTNTRVKKLEYEFNHLNTSTTGGVAPAPGTQPLADRITRLERNELVIAHDLNVLHSDVSQLSQNQDSLHRTVAQIQGNLNAVRTVAFSAQDVLNELTRTTAQLEHQLTQLSPVVDANARQIALLSPLGLLLVNGMPGLRNLEKLERKPCQCPQLPGLPGDDAGLLAAYEFVTNG